jgi:hypothetical protein
MIHTHFIKQFRVLAHPTIVLPELDPQANLVLQKTLLPIKSINWEDRTHKESAGIRMMREKMSRIGVGVGRDAQDIFDSLSKTMECRWHEQNIIVLDSVVITAPYRSKDCKGNEDRVLNRVRKVVRSA